MIDEFSMAPKELAKRLTVEERLTRVGLPEGLTPRQANAITMARLQYALSDLTEQVVPEVLEWLRQVAAVAPAEALRLYMELLEFRMPRMKAAQVSLSAVSDLRSGERELKDMSIEELNRIVAEQ